MHINRYCQQKREIVYLHIKLDRQLYLSIYLYSIARARNSKNFVSYTIILLVRQPMTNQPYPQSHKPRLDYEASSECRDTFFFPFYSFLFMQPWLSLQYYSLVCWQLLVRGWGQTLCLVSKRKECLRVIHIMNNLLRDLLPDEPFQIFGAFKPVSRLF